MDALNEVEADLRSLVLALARSAADSGRRTSFDDVLVAFGQTRESLAVDLWTAFMSVPRPSEPIGD